MRINNNRNLVFPALFDDFLVRDLFGAAKEHNIRNTMPAVNIKETDGAYELELSAPGMDKGDFKIEIENDTLTISAQRETKAEEKSGEGNYTRREFSYQSFQRAFNLPENDVDSEQVSASYKDGILYILVPKKEQVKSKAVKAVQVV
ncbi:MAG: Hsp20/alpha crystallin family protein [Bacteroidia bacterium]